MELKGKRIAFLGDSITEGHGLVNTEGAYWNLLKEREGLAEIYVDGIGGTRISRQWTPSEKPRHDLDFVSRVKDIPEGMDVIVVFGGTNDFGHGDAPLGVRGERSPYTFYGACDLLIRSLMGRFGLYDTSSPSGGGAERQAAGGLCEGSAAGDGVLRRAGGEPVRREWDSAQASDK